jgi:Protein of unknown function (DUF2934)
MNTSTESTDDRDETIRRRAYMIWLAEGQPHGRAEDHWYQAVAEIQQETEQKVSFEASNSPPATSPRPSRKRNDF